jgi:glycosyltransferase involved in cell wall biosynthesis
MENLTVVVPFFNGHATIGRLLDSLPDVPVIVVDDHSDKPLQLEGTRVVWNRAKGYFSGAVNTGIGLCDTDVLVLNQDVRFKSREWVPRLDALRKRYALVGDGVSGHRAWPKGYVQGTFMFMRRDAIDDVGPLNAEEYPLWGATCEWQLRACRMGHEAHVSQEWRRWMDHDGRHEDGRQMGRRRRYGSAISEALRREPGKHRLFLRTPPAISVIMPCFNYGRYLTDAVNSLLGGPTSIGEMAPQTFQSFEIVIVDDASTDGSWEIAKSLADPWKGVRAIRLPENRGTPGALNAGVEASFGEYIHVLSADDMREAWGLEVLYEKCKEGPKVVAYGDIRLVKDGKRGRMLRLPGYNFDAVLTKNPMPAGIMYPRQAWREVGGYPEEMVYGREDWAFNIALGLKGYCGHHCGMSGNLYRREGQNRSLRTGNKHKGEVGQGFSWRKTFMEQLQALYPSAYGGERPVGCCGGRGGSRPRANPRGMKSLPGQQGMTLLEYVGGNYGDQTWHGAVTRQRYVFGLSKPISYVDSRDAKQLLNSHYHGKPLFRVAKEQQPKIPEEQQAVANPPVPVTHSITPRAQEVAEEMGVDWTKIAGTGAGNRITVRDVRAVA